MGQNSAISWTDHTFNPWWGCRKVSAGCANCYAETFARRTGQACFGDGPRRIFGDKHWNEPKKWAEQARKAGKRSKVFCASMADVFEDAPGLDEQLARLWTLIRETADALDWLLLTKRAYRLGIIPEGVARLCWLGVTVENQAAADERIPLLLQTPAALRFLSCEPLIAEVDLDLPRCDVHDRDEVAVGNDGEFCNECAADGWSGELSHGHWLDPLNGGIGWVIVGGESGPRARPMALGWARSLVGQCREAEVPCFVKQLGRKPTGWWLSSGNGTLRGNVFPGNEATRDVGHWRLKDLDGRDPAEWPEDLRVQEWPEVSR